MKISIKRSVNCNTTCCITSTAAQDMLEFYNMYGCGYIVTNNYNPWRKVAEDYSMQQIHETQTTPQSLDLKTGLTATN